MDVRKVDEDPEDELDKPGTTIGTKFSVLFSIGGYDYRRTARFRQSIHFSITQVLLADHVH